jgi:hypothetical protein
VRRVFLSCSLTSLGLWLGLAITIYIRCTYVFFGWESLHIRFWPSLVVITSSPGKQVQCHSLLCSLTLPSGQIALWSDCPLVRSPSRLPSGQIVLQIALQIALWPCPSKSFCHVSKRKIMSFQSDALCEGRERLQFPLVVFVNYEWVAIELPGGIR